MKNKGDDARAVRTAGAVLIAIGMFAVAVSLWWNAKDDEFPRDSLVRTMGTAIAVETKVVKTKTSHDEWIVVDVTREIVGGAGSERWVFPSHSERIEAGLARLQLPAEVSGLLVKDPVLVRWEDESIRLLWALRAGDEEVVPYSLVHEIEAEARYASPVIGIITMVLGLGLIMLSRATS